MKHEDIICLYPNFAKMFPRTYKHRHTIWVQTDDVLMFFNTKTIVILVFT